MTNLLIGHVVKFLSLFPSGASFKESTHSARDRSGRSPRGRHGNPLQYSCLENPTDSAVWRATVHKVAKRGT